jgi:hypothetical protein
MIREFTVGASKTVNMGNFNSLRVEASVTYTLEEGQEFRDQYTICMHQLKSMLNDNYKIQLKQQDTTNERANEFPGN